MEGSDLPAVESTTSLPGEQTNLADAALQYARHELGFKVLPLHTPVRGLCDCPRGSTCSSPGKHPRTEHGLKDATRDEITVRDWWIRWPIANIGLVLPPSLLVVDVDGSEGEQALRAAGFVLSPTLNQATGRGYHCFYWARRPVRPMVGIVDHVDVRGLDSYVTAAPSVHVSGSVYRWLNPDAPIADAPAWIESRSKPFLRVTGLPARIPMGERNVTLTSIAGNLRRAGLAESEMAGALLAANASRCDPPLDGHEVLAIARSVARYPAGATSASGAPASPAKPDPDVFSAISLFSQPQPLGAEALIGLPGRYVKVVARYSEASVAALLFTFLPAMGVAVGLNVRARAGDVDHPARLNTLLVGVTAKGRKGTASAPARTLLQLADPFLVTRNGGLSTGEGLISLVRDRVEKLVKGELVVVDEGVDDKRLLLTEPEFASVLRRMEREGNSLSAVIRNAYDVSDLATLTRASPMTATGAHIAITGHSTKDEVIRYLPRTELANGFANRFLFCETHRERVLPDAEGVPQALIQPLASELKAIIAWARTPRLLRRDSAASDAWRSVYADLSEGRPGLLGAATNRAEAQVLRLSVAYAIADMAEEIRLEHLLAALEVWRYAFDSAAWIFGNKTGNRVADSILLALRATDSMTRTDIVNLFDRREGRAAIDEAIGMLAAQALIIETKEPTPGRPRTVYRAA
jgi:hypothetical protein